MPPMLPKTIAAQNTAVQHAQQNVQQNTQPKKNYWDELIERTRNQALVNKKTMSDLVSDWMANHKSQQETATTTTYTQPIIAEPEEPTVEQVIEPKVKEQPKPIVQPVAEQEEPTVKKAIEPEITEQPIQTAGFMSYGDPRQRQNEKQNTPAPVKPEETNNEWANLIEQEDKAEEEAESVRQSITPQRAEESGYVAPVTNNLVDALLYGGQGANTVPVNIESYPRLQATGFVNPYDFSQFQADAEARGIQIPENVPNYWSNDINSAIEQGNNPQPTEYINPSLSEFDEQMELNALIEQSPWYDEAVAMYKQSGLPQAEAEMKARELISENNTDADGNNLFTGEPGKRVYIDTPEEQVVYGIEAGIRNLLNGTPGDYDEATQAELFDEISLLNNLVDPANQLTDKQINEAIDNLVETNGQLDVSEDVTAEEVAEQRAKETKETIEKNQETLGKIFSKADGSEAQDVDINSILSEASDLGLKPGTDKFNSFLSRKVASTIPDEDAFSTDSTSSLDGVIGWSSDGTINSGTNQATGDLQLQSDIANGKITYEQIYDDYVKNHVSGLYQRYLESGMDEATANQTARQNAQRLAYQRIYDLGYRPDYNDPTSVDRYVVPGMIDIIEGMEQGIGNNYWTNGASYNDRLTNMVSGGIEGRDDRLLDDLMSYSAGNAYLNEKNGTDYGTTFKITDPANANNPSGWNTALQAAMSGQLTKDQILHIYDSQNSDLVIPDEAKKFFTDPSHAIQQLFLNNGKNAEQTQSVEATSEEFQKALEALLNANPALKLMVDNGVLTTDDVAYYFFKELKLKNTDNLKSKYKSYGNGYGGYGGFGGYGISGGYGPSYGYNSASAKDQNDTRIHNIMKNWTF